MTSEDRRLFVHRVGWLIIPGLISGLITGGIAWGTIQTQITYMERTIHEIRQTNREQDGRINRNRVLIYQNWRHNGSKGEN